MMFWIAFTIVLFAGVMIGLLLAGLLHSAAADKMDEIPL